MKRTLGILIFIGSFLCLNACRDAQETVVETANPPEEAPQQLRCLPGQTSGDGQCMCGEIGLNPDDATDWGCINDIWLCMNEVGCKNREVYYPNWGYLGDNAPGKIPKMPKEHAGYMLRRIDVPIDGLGVETRMVWSCVASTCKCGDVQIDNAANCIEEKTPIYAGVVCGGTVCQMADTCKGGECWCGDTPQTADNVNHYKCVNGKPLCQDLGGCDCAGTACPLSAACDANGCTCGETKIENMTDVEKYGCRNGILVCINKAGCQCGDKICPENSACSDGKCMCGGVPIGTRYDSTKYKCTNGHAVCTAPNGCKCGHSVCPQNGICAEDQCFCGDSNIKQKFGKLAYADGYNSCVGNDLICTREEGCACGDGYTPKGGTCVHGQGHCYGVPIDKQDLGVMNSGYVCENNIPQPECQNPDGCACGETTCPMHTACNQGQCAYRTIPDVQSLIGDNFDQYIITGLATKEYRIDSVSDECLKMDYKKVTPEYGMVCQNRAGCACGSHTCLYGEQCTIDGCICGSSPDGIEDEKIEMYRANHYACLNPNEICNSNTGCSIACESESGCPCGDKICPKTTTCNKDDDDGYQCYCNDDALPLINAEDNGNYICYSERDDINGLSCQSETGCSCGNSYCAKNAICTLDGCMCNDDELPILGKEDIAGYVCKQYSDDGLICLICTLPDGCKCGDTYCAKNANCTADGCQCGLEDLPVLNKEDIAEYECKRYVKDDDNGLICKSATGCKCGDTYCPQDAFCTKKGCECDDDIIPVLEKEESSEYKCVWYSEDGESTGLVCISDDGCKCGSNYCAKNAICTKDGCECDDEITPVLSKKDIASYECFTSESTEDEGKGLICQSDKGCTCGDSYCAKNARCTKDGCDCNDDDYPELSQEDVTSYVCYWDIMEGKKYEKDTTGNGLICQSEDGCKCGDSYCAMNARCTENGCDCNDESMPEFEKKDLAGYTCNWDDDYKDDLNKTGLFCTSKTGCKCGNSYCPENGTCTTDGCLCTSNSLPVLSQKDLEMYTCYIDSSKATGLLCESESGCKCGDDICPLGAGCTDLGCECGKLDIFLEPGEAKSFVCQDGKMICIDAKGCTCGSEHCKKGKACFDDACVSPDEIEDSDEDEDDDLEDDFENDVKDSEEHYGDDWDWGGGSPGCDEDDPCCDGTVVNTENSYYSEGRSEGNIRLCPEKCEDQDGSEIDDCVVSSCTNCANFTCEVTEYTKHIEYEGDETLLMSGAWKCLMHGGCKHSTRHYAYDMYINPPDSPFAKEQTPNGSEQFCKNDICSCGTHQCIRSESCRNGECVCANDSMVPGCLCGSSILKAGYRCINGQQICQIAELKYAYDYYKNIRKYKASYTQAVIGRFAIDHMDINKIANYRCACGDGFVNNGETCTDGKLCTACTHIGLKTNDNGYLEGECKGKKIQYMQRNKILEQFTFIDSPDEKFSALHFSAPEVCSCTFDMPEHHDAYYCEMVSAKGGGNYYYQYGGWVCGNAQCECGTEVCQKGERCSKGHCIKKSNRLTDYCPTLDAFNGITYENGVCACNNVPMDSQELKNYICVNGTVWKCVKDACMCGDYKIYNGSYCLGPNVCGGNSNCYNVRERMILAIKSTIK